MESHSCCLFNSVCVLYKYMDSQSWLHQNQCTELGTQENPPKKAWILMRDHGVSHTCSLQPSNIEFTWVYRFKEYVRIVIVMYVAACLSLKNKTSVNLCSRLKVDWNALWTGMKQHPSSILIVCCQGDCLTARWLRLRCLQLHMVEGKRTPNPKRAGSNAMHEDVKGCKVSKWRTISGQWLSKIINNQKSSQNRRTFTYSFLLEVYGFICYLYLTFSFLPRRLCCERLHIPIIHDISPTENTKRWQSKSLKGLLAAGWWPSSAMVYEWFMNVHDCCIIGGNWVTAFESDSDSDSNAAICSQLAS